MVLDYVMIGQRIKGARKKKKFTQEKLAESLDVSTVYISQIENGKTKLSLEMLVRIAYLLNTEAGYFLTGTIFTVDEKVPHEITVILQNSSPKKLKLIAEIIKTIDKY
jgi:transcriptional regulator with XRE-family HTH domain